MAPLKFEDHIKEKLEKRVMKPSTNAWNELEAQLDSRPMYQSKTQRWFIGIAAASVVLLLLFLSQNEFLQKNDATMQTVKVVSTKDDSTPQTMDKSLYVENSDSFKIETNTEDKKSVSHKNQKKKEIHSFKIKNTPASINLELAVAEKQETNVVDDTFELSFNSEVFVEDSLVNRRINSKVSELLAQVEEMEKNNGQVTSEEIDNLLRKAQLEITTNKLIKEGKTNAMSLLEDVEIELDETFKQRVFETLKTSFSKFRTAVAERDN